MKTDLPEGKAAHFRTNVVMGIDYHPWAEPHDAHALLLSRLARQPCDSARS